MNQILDLARRRPGSFFPLLLILALSCTKDRPQDLPPIPPLTKPEVSKRVVRARLRVTNVGSDPILGLTVQFVRDHVFFGDVQPGETTEYQDVPNGVLRYAAFEYTRDGRRMGQGVTDWMGATPLGGNFTYNLRFAPVELGHNLIRPQLVIEKVIQE